MNFETNCNDFHDAGREIYNKGPIKHISFGVCTFHIDKAEIQPRLVYEVCPGFATKPMPMTLE